MAMWKTMVDCRSTICSNWAVGLEQYRAIKHNLPALLHPYITDKWRKMLFLQQIWLDQQNVSPIIIVIASNRMRHERTLCLLESVVYELCEMRQPQPRGHKKYISLKPNTPELQTGLMQPFPWKVPHPLWSLSTLYTFYVRCPVIW